MGFGNKKPAMAISSSRLASVAGAPAASAASSSPQIKRIACPEPDLSRIRPRRIQETPEERKRRLAAKTVNFTVTIIARIVILIAAGLFLWTDYLNSVQYGWSRFHYFAFLGMMTMVGDLGRVIIKASTHGTK